MISDWTEAMKTKPAECSEAGGGVLGSPSDSRLPKTFDLDPGMEAGVVWHVRTRMEMRFCGQHPAE